jgi:hypothetical protein
LFYIFLFLFLAAPHSLFLPPPSLRTSGEKPKKPKRIIKQRQSLAEKQPGTTIFPMARVKRIIKADKELDMMTGEACFMVAVATVCLALPLPPAATLILEVAIFDSHGRVSLSVLPAFSTRFEFVLTSSGILHQAFYGRRIYEGEAG